jgi:hypothetical protein
MTIIHITLDDNGEALAVAAALLNQGYTITIDLDEMSDDETVEDIDHLTRRHPVTYGDGTTEWVREETEIVNAWDGTPVIVNSKQAVIDQRWRDVQVARNVACPSCKAKIDWPCTTPKGKAYGNFAHIERIQNGYNLKNGVL